MKILLCTEVEDQFSHYMDGSLSGVAMAEMQEHIRHCRECALSFTAWQATIQSLNCLGPAKVPPTLGLQLRVAISRQRSHTWGARMEQLRLRWENTLGPFAMRASAGFATAVLMVGTLALLIGTLAAPEPAAARSEPEVAATPPRFLYVSQPDGFSPSLTMNGSAVVRVYVDASGHVYDYRVLSGAVNQANRSAIADEMLWSVFAPARAFGARLAHPLPDRCFRRRIARLVLDSSLWTVRLNRHKRAAFAALLHYCGADPETFDPEELESEGCDPDGAGGSAGASGGSGEAESSSTSKIRSAFGGIGPRPISP